MNDKERRERAKKDLAALIMEGKINGLTADLFRQVEEVLDVLEEDPDEEETQ